MPQFGSASTDVLGGLSFDDLLDREVVAIRAAGLSEAELVEAVHRAWPAPRR